MKTPYYVVDAFASGPFTGNPAGVCPLEKWLPDALMGKIAAENALSETAFLVEEGGGWRLRWFAPGGEVDLCGHATLAAAFVLGEVLGRPGDPFRFASRVGDLAVARRDKIYALDFPALPMKKVSAPRPLAKGLGAKPKEAFEGMDWVAVFEDAEKVRGLKPDLEMLKILSGRGVIATAPAEGGYVLRCFGPKFGIPEDPVTGSAQSMLAPFWAKRLGRREFKVRQLSARGGEMACTVKDGRVEIAGTARLYLSGHIELENP